jgi:hypothetical protein
MSTKTVDGVVVHPLVLLSVVDHYNRVARDTRRRVVGVLLGESYQGRGEWCGRARAGNAMRRQRGCSVAPP